MNNPNLRTFLKQHKVLTKFKTNYKNHRSFSPTVEIFLKQPNNHRRGITKAFPWYATPEGGQFWETLHNKRLKQCLQSGTG